MMLAAADLGRYDEGAPPPVLREAWLIKRWGALPEAGGLRDQPAGLLQKAARLLDIYQAHKAYKDALLSQKGDALGEWEQRNMDVMNLLADIRKLRRQVEGSR